MKKCPKCGESIEFLLGHFLAQGHILKCDHCQVKLRAKGTNKGWIALVAVVFGIGGIALANLAESEWTYWMLVAAFCVGLITFVNIMEMRITRLEIVG
jgi:uncharacterized protein (DUF983 family)